MNSTEIPLEITEDDVQNTEVVQDDNVVYEVDSASSVESTEETFVDLEDAAESVEVEEVESTEIMETETTVLSDPEEAEATDGLESTIVAVDYTDALVLVHEELVHMNQSLDIVVMVLLAWFGSWVFRSWRTWTVKGGK